MNKYKLYMVSEETYPYNVKVEDSEGVYKFAVNELKMCQFPEEYIYMLCIGNKMNVIGVHEISHGGQVNATIDIKNIFKRALLSNARGIVLLHNHPSGDVSPSFDDMALTDAVVEAGKILGIKVFDHLIIGDQMYTSFLKEGMLNG